MKTKSLALTGLTMLLASTLVACSNNNSGNTSKSEKPKDVSTKTVKKSSKKVTEIPKDDKHDWFFKDDIFYAGMETYKLTKSEIRDSVDEGKKVLVIYTDVTNNSNKEQDPSNIYMVMHAFQKTDTADKDLMVGMVGLDDNGNNPLQQYEDGLNDKLLPGKTTHAVIIFALENDSKVTVKFSNSDSKTIGTKTYDVQ